MTRLILVAKAGVNDGIAGISVTINGYFATFSRFGMGKDPMFKERMFGCVKRANER
jgi:hypothetical protein